MFWCNQYIWCCCWSTDAPIAANLWHVMFVQVHLSPPEPRYPDSTRDNVTEAIITVWFYSTWEVLKGKFYCTYQPFFVSEAPDVSLLARRSLEPGLIWTLMDSTDRRLFGLSWTVLKYLCLVLYVFQCKWTRDWTYQAINKMSANISAAGQKLKPERSLF